MCEGSSLVQPWWEAHGLHPFPFHLHSGASCSELAAAFLSRLGQSWGKAHQRLIRASPLLSLWPVATQAAVRSSSFPEQTLCAVCCLRGRSLWEAPGQSLGQPGAQLPCTELAQPHPNTSTPTSQMWPRGSRDAMELFRV